MSFNPGDPVHVRALGKGTVREVRGNGRVVVEIKGRTLIVSVHELTPVEQKRSGTSDRARDVPADAALPTRGHAAASIDLHGMTTDEAVAALDAFVSDAMLAGLPDVRVIHGRSGGRLKAAVHARLKQIPSVRAFRLDPGNPGVTIVML